MALDFLSRVVDYADRFISDELFTPHGDLNKFITQVKSKGLARGTHYMVTLNSPASLKIPQRREALGSKSDTYYAEMFALMCKSAQLPGLSFATNQIRTYGEPMEIPYEKIYDNVSLTFYVDANMETKSFFDQWMDSIQLYSTKGFSFYDEYKTTIAIDVFNMEHTKDGAVKVYSVLLHEAYPKSIQAIELDYESQGVMLLTVNFQYKNWVSASFETQKSGIKTIFDELFGDNPIYTGVMKTYGWIGDVLETSDSYIDRFERAKGALGNLKTQSKSIPGLIKGKINRVKDLRKFL